ncbi:hypothetical protein FOB58_001153 [Candida parapsilosis]|uniref:Uncharacterized protein n=2 Tax=Candida parapsilosis TaxID=5480 RepID=G8BFI5_CANPC|nr:uncharacterized protein CPAR2_202620 [Candida parapsilosis]KAF6055231.1 hypothetical protein FOB58_001153 [Candida parapsilosis]KAF6055746.1 hypothetical protein FOB59_000258 [Candida parapsilosis]KAF6058676.1 hypothetical protein FOB60_000258 [Candida parapsilosis]KAF6067433.1 hypothetical protein FOB61_000258 [Candida parapsilosis]KAI5901342.1 hypothetical protein K4G60_g478 [Candida parapsilosis]
MALCPKPYTFEKHFAASSRPSSHINTNGRGASKRGCDFLYPSTTANKRICLQQSRRNDFELADQDLDNNKYYSSSSDDADSEDEQSCYNADQIRAKRRASTRASFSIDPKLSKAISQYSDDEDEDEDQVRERYYNTKVKSPCCSRRTSDSSIKILRSEDEIENLDCKLASSPVNSSLSLKKMLVGGGNECDDDDDDEEEEESDSNNQSVAIADRNARARCFEYLVGAIDEAWARYCDATAYVEDEVHGYITPASLASGDDDEEEEDDNKELMNVKCRLLKSKDFLQDHIESFDMNDVKKFWHRWDITKYQMLDVMEDEDDVLEELESGRRIF